MQLLAGEAGLAGSLDVGRLLVLWRATRRGYVELRLSEVAIAHFQLVIQSDRE